MEPGDEAKGAVAAPVDDLTASPVRLMKREGPCKLPELAGIRGMACPEAHGIAVE